jgi:hypothetical protein
LVEATPPHARTFVVFFEELQQTMEDPTKAKDSKDKELEGSFFGRFPFFFFIVFFFWLSLLYLKVSLSFSNDHQNSLAMLYEKKTPHSTKSKDSRTRQELKKSFATLVSKTTLTLQKSSPNSRNDKVTRGVSFFFSFIGSARTIFFFF